MGILPSKISKGQAIVLMIIAWFVGWQYHSEWTEANLWLVAEVWQPYEIIWTRLIWIGIAGMFGVMMGLPIYLYWKDRKWKEAYEYRQIFRVLPRVPLKEA